MGRDLLCFQMGVPAPGRTPPMRDPTRPHRRLLGLPALGLSAKGDGAHPREECRPPGKAGTARLNRAHHDGLGVAWTRGGGLPSSSSSKSSTKNSRNGGRFGRLSVLTSCWIFADTRLLTGTPGRQKHRQTKGRDGQHLTRGPSSRDAAAGALS